MDQSRSPFGELTPSLLRRAVDLYLALAYGDVGPPVAVNNRLLWPDAEVATLVAAKPFETSQAVTPHGRAAVYSLRLGNRFYPHMKLQVQPWPHPAGYLLSVNTHDQIEGLAADAPGRAEFLAMQSANQALKEAIEQAWDDEGLPTFHRYLRTYLEGQDESSGG